MFLHFEHDMIILFLLIVRTVNEDYELTSDGEDAWTYKDYTWADQFRNALKVKEGDVNDVTMMDRVIHVLLFVWKVRAAPCVRLLGLT